MANNPSDLIQFKRGTMAALETLITNNSGIDGTFYLTVDDDAAGSTNNPSKSSRLFVGRADGSIVPVNQGIITVSNLSDLTNNVEGKWHAGDYAYVTNGNILAIYDGKTWKQINAVGDDTFVQDFSTDITANSNVATVTSTVHDNFGGGDGRDLPASFNIEGANGLQVTATARAGETPAKVTITGDTYTLSRGAAASNQSEISLASANTDNDSSVVIKGGDNVTVSTSGDNVVEIASTDFGIYDINLAADETAGFKVNITQNDNLSTPRESNVLDPTIVLGDNTSTPVHFANGVATLPVYTKAEIDAQKRALDAMRYRGTVGYIDNDHTGSYADSIENMAAPSVGDTFKIVGNNTVLPAAKNAASGETVTLKEGDIIIAMGTEDPTTGAITSGLMYDVIPAGNETDSQYNLAGIEHGVQLTGSYDTIQNSGSFGLVEGNQITLTDSGESDAKRVTVNHATITTASPTTNAKNVNTTQNNGTAITLPIISDISVNNGHVTGWTIQNYEVIDTSVVLNSLTSTASAANNVATVSTTLNYNDQTGTERDDIASSFTVSSDNLNVTAANSDVKVNFVWGTFAA